MANVDMKVECNWQFSLYGLPIRSCGTSWLQVGLAEKGAETALHKHQTLKHNYAVLSTQKWPHSTFITQKIATMTDYPLTSSAPH
jgi:hypothetical protein